MNIFKWVVSIFLSLCVMACAVLVVVSLTYLASVYPQTTERVVFVSLCGGITILWLVGLSYYIYDRVFG